MLPATGGGQPHRSLLCPEEKKIKELLSLYASVTNLKIVGSYNARRRFIKLRILTRQVIYVYVLLTKHCMWLKFQICACSNVQCSRWYSRSVVAKKTCIAQTAMHLVALARCAAQMCFFRLPVRKGLVQCIKPSPSLDPRLDRVQIVNFIAIGLHLISS